MSSIATRIKSAYNSINNTIDRGIDYPLKKIGLEASWRTTIRSAIKSSASLYVGSLFVSKILYPPLKPHILRLIPDVDLSYKAIQSLETSARILEKGMKNFGIVAPLSVIAYTMSSQVASKLQADGKEFITHKIINKNINVEMPTYGDKINKKIAEFKSVITNNTVTDSRTTKNKVKSFVFHGSAGTGKTSIMKYLANSFSKSVKGETLYYQINSSHLTEQSDWQFEQIISHISDHKTTTPVLNQQFENAYPDFFNKQNDAIVIEFDEIDQMGNDKMARLQGFYDKLKETGANVLFMGTTNFINKLPEALQSRTGDILEIGLPSAEECNKILEKQCKGYTELTINEKQTIIIKGLYEQLKNKFDANNNGTETLLGLSGRDIETVFNKTADLFNAELAEKQHSYTANNELNKAGLEKITEIFKQKLHEFEDRKGENNQEANG